MHGDNCSATRVETGPKTNSTSFGMKAEHYALPCRDNVLVENGDVLPKSCLPSLEMRSPSAAGGLLPTGETSTAMKITFNRPPLRLYLTEETNLKTLTQVVSYDSSFWDIVAAPSYRRVIRKNPYKTGRSIQAVFKVISAPTRFWDRGARCFVGRFMLELGEAAAFFGGSMIRDSKAFRSDTGEILRRMCSSNSLTPRR